MGSPLSPRTGRLAASHVLGGTDYAVGDVLAGKYRVDAVLGAGGMGVVLRAQHLDLGCPVAIKLPRRGLEQCEDATTRLLVEAQAAASIRSEHVARVLDVGRLEGGAPFLVLEYLDGCDLASVVRDHGHLATHTAVDFVLQACRALSEAHSAGIVHCDLKPENLFLSSRADGTPVVKVLDFGISRRLEPADAKAAGGRDLELLGSPLYMAPEQMRGGSGLDARTDIWALGVVLYELCTGHSPFQADGVAAICARVIGMDPLPPRASNPSLPEGLEAIVLRCLRKDAAARPANVADLARELAPFGSSDATAQARSALAVLSRTPARCELELELAPLSLEALSPHTPTAMSATLAVFGQAHYAQRPRRLRKRTRWVGATLALATVLGGGLSLHASYAKEATLRGASWVALASRGESSSCPAPSDVKVALTPATVAAAEVDAVNTLPATTASSLDDTPSVKRARKAAVRNAWDPKSFGARL